MSRLCMTLLGILVFTPVLAAQQSLPPKTDGPLKTTAAQASYGIGLNIGRQLKSEGLEIDVEALALGIKDVFGDAEPKLTQAQIREAINAFSRLMQEKAVERARAIGERNRREGPAFLTANGKKAGVVTLPSGLQYTVLKEGDGPSPKATDTVRTHYHGTLLDGTVFDSSVERQEPISFPVNGVIAGWTEALQRMKVGSKWRLFIPSELAYGAEGAGEDIGPHAVLVFDVELLGIE